jgi:aspartyl-tRNA(Asn)/glutamyl-tRNA(Gln) amidotransferase subunit C
MKPPIDMDYVCALARLELSAEEKTILAPQMIKIIEWVGQISNLRLNGSDPEASCPSPVPLPFREDEIRASLSVEEALANSPEKNSGFIKVPKVIEEK